MVIITRVIYKTVCLWSQHYVLPAVVMEGVLSLGMIPVSTSTYNYKADRRARVCLRGDTICHIKFMRVTFGLVLALIHIFFSFLFLIPLLWLFLKCCVMLSLDFIFQFLSFCTKKKINLNEQHSPEQLKG